MYGLYIHLPFCVNKCPYCGFYSETGISSQCMENYLNACLLEIKSLPAVCFDTVYIGGGTPSSIGGNLLADFMNQAVFFIQGDLKEVTVEVNPESVTIGLCRALNDTPVTRYSMGMQSLSDTQLTRLGRIHSAEQAQKAYELLRKESPGKQINLDIIYDIPEAPEREIYASVAGIMALQPEHISAYSYSPDTGYLTDKSTDDPAQTERVAELLDKGGYQRYEVSNFAVPGNESLHNSKYWDMQGYYGIGAGAHSMVEIPGGRKRYCHLPDINRYIRNPLKEDDVELYDKATIIKESIIFGLRRSRGIDLEEVKQRWGKVDDATLEKINFLGQQGLLDIQGNKICATKKGLLLLDSVMSYLW